MQYVYWFMIFEIIYRWVMNFMICFFNYNCFIYAIEILSWFPFIKLRFTKQKLHLWYWCIIAWRHKYTSLDPIKFYIMHFSLFSYFKIWTSSFFLFGIVFYWDFAIYFLIIYYIWGYLVMGHIFYNVFSIINISFMQ